MYTTDATYYNTLTGGTFGDLGWDCEEGVESLSEAIENAIFSAPELDAETGYLAAGIIAIYSILDESGEVVCRLAYAKKERGEGVPVHVDKWLLD